MWVHVSWQHAAKCIAWEEAIIEERTEMSVLYYADHLSRYTDLTVYSIIERLQHLGYQDEINHQGLDGVKNLYESAFASARPFTDAGMSTCWLNYIAE